MVFNCFNEQDLNINKRFSTYMIDKEMDDDVMTDIEQLQGATILCYNQLKEAIDNAKS